MVASNLDGLVGHRALDDEGPIPVIACHCVFGRVFQASVCITFKLWHVRAIPTYRVYRFVLQSAMTCGFEDSYLVVPLI